jgi:hypothetical protein
VPTLVDSISVLDRVWTSLLVSPRSCINHIPLFGRIYYCSCLRAHVRMVPAFIAQHGGSYQHWKPPLIQLQYNTSARPLPVWVLDKTKAPPCRLYSYAPPCFLFGCALSAPVGSYGLLQLEFFHPKKELRRFGCFRAFPQNFNFKMPVRQKILQYRYI